MNWLVDNPIGGMYGPHFLVFYGTMIAFTLAICWWWIWQSDTSEHLPPLELPRQVDPYAVAYLRSGKNEVIRLAIFDLLQNGYLEMVDANLEAIDEKGQGDSGQKKWLSQSASKKVRGDVAPVAQTVWKWFHSPRRPDEVFRGELPAKVEARCKEYQRWMESESLTLTEGRTASLQARWMGTLLIAGLGGYKLVVALSQGRHNVMFLVFMGVIGLVLLFVACKPRRLSRRGKHYLERLQTTFEGLKRQTSSALMGGPKQDLLLATGVFGIVMLASTPYGFFGDVFKRGTRSSGGCGGGCGAGGGGGGGGCGGGGGGCGGGGCGGGGCGGCGGD
jgi:uncharacterized protein (TIGR04222 family)